MLSHLLIKNYILIDKIEIDFNPGLTVITGETGAGKSILFGALSLLKGRRADLAELKDPTQKCILELRVDLKKYRLREVFEAEELDYQEEAIFRREVNPQGKSRAFINDTPVRLEQMQKLADLLFDIHGQQQSLEINKAEPRLSIIDEVAGNHQLLSEYKRQFREFKVLEKSFQTLKDSAAQSVQEQDYLQFQFDELEKAKLQKGEEEQLNAEHQVLANGDELIGLAAQILELTNSEENSSLAGINSAARLMEELSTMNPELSELSDRFRSAQIELTDIVNEVEMFKDNFDLDAERLQFIEERLSEIHRLKQKHLKDSAEELIELQEDIEGKLLEISNYDDELARIEQQLEAKKAELQANALKLSENRQAVFSDFSKAVSSTLVQLGIPHANFQLQREEVELNASGFDRIDFLFSANAGKFLQPVAQSASGGELSRIMLAIKRELANRKLMPALLFDEIDTGVSGEIADQLGKILREMASSHQIISITHLPQLAAKGSHHYFVYKQTSSEVSQTYIKKLTDKDRVEELAKMLSGSTVTEAAVNNARELLAQ